ncbi:MAG: UDP-N-acetylmuramoyl-L-alanine--D-glutamate ligase [Clostridia bacterium]|nr:UDP-N-acetylmuramoyl-L-alanine--D-glutamate ligase [Clostridia bacterium]
MNLIGKNVVVYGAGVSGTSAYELAKDMGAKVIIYDDDPSASRATNSVGVFSGADVIVLSPGVSSEKDFLFDAKLENKTVISELELASSVTQAEQIAITGTNGKTTTTRLIDSIFKAAGRSSRAVGNIGVAFSSIADKLTKDDVAVIEASSFQLEGCINFAPHVAVLLNVTPDHLERHGCMRKYVEAKSKIFARQTEKDFFVYNADDDVICGLLDKIVAKKVPFCLTHPMTDGAYISSGFVCFKGAPILSVEEMDFKGRELENVLAAVAVAMIYGVSPYAVSKAITTFKKDKYRRELLAVKDGISIFNDSKATNVYSCLSACEAMDGDFVLIIGGARREENFDELFAHLPTTAKRIVVCGENEKEILLAAHNCDFDSVDTASDLKTAFSLAYEYARAHRLKNLLFSPSSKSFDAFENYEKRGAAFERIVKEYD